MADTTEPVPTPQFFSGDGVPGVKRTGGYVNEEWLRELSYNRGLKAYREMSDTDPIIGGLLNLIGGLFRTISWTVEPKDPGNPDDVAAQELVQEEVDGLSPSIRELMTEALDLFPFGFAIAEQVYSRRKDGKIGWAEWIFMAPETRDRWIFDQVTDNVLAFVQRSPSDYKERIIPIAKCLHLRTTRRKGNPEGKSILRNAWRNWFFKSKLEEIEAIGCERDLAGLPVMRIPLKYTDTNASPEEKAVYENAKRLVRNVRRDEHEGLVLPSNRDGETKEFLVDFTLMSTGGTRSIDVSKVIERHDARIAMSALADFLLLGHQQVGTFSLSSDKTSMFSVVFGGYADALAEELTRQAADRLTALNGMPGHAVIQHGDFEKTDIAIFSNSLKNLTAAGIIIPGEPNLEAYVRDQLNLPEPDAEWLDAQQASEEATLSRLAATNPKLMTAAGIASTANQPGAKPTATTAADANPDNQDG